jgi:hypothetical protein
MQKTKTKTTAVAIPVRGSTTIAQLADALGARPDGHAYTFRADFEIVGKREMVKASASISNADKEGVLAALTPAEKKAVEKFQRLCKEAAAARTDGVENPRETWNGIVKA